MNKLSFFVPCFALSLFLAHCTDDDSTGDGTGGAPNSGGSVNGGSRSGGASGTGAGSGGQSGSAGSEATGGSGGQSGASGNAGQGGTGQGGGGDAGDGGEGASGGASACQPEGGDAECKECMRSSCCDAVPPCEADTECSDCVDCLDDVGDVGMCSSGAMTVCPLVSMEGATRDMLLCLLEECSSECGFL